ncbi:MAG TPA: hypothetical protein VF282_01575 [Bacillota bacterium]
MKALIETAKSLLIVVLLVSSVLLSARLWLPPTPAVAVPESYRAPFVAPGAVATLDWTTTLQPLTLWVHLQQRGLGQVDPGSEFGRFLWAAVRRAAATVPASDLVAVPAAEVDRLRRGGVGGGVGVEAVLPGRVRLSAWRELWAAATRPDTADDLEPALDGPVDRVMVLFEGGDAWVLFRGEQNHLGARVPAPAAGSATPDDDPAAQSVASLQQLLNLVATLDAEIDPAVAPPAPAAGLSVLPGVYAPVVERELPLLRYEAASLRWDRLHRSFTANPGLSRKVAAGDVILYTDDGGTLSVRPDDGLAEYQAPPVPADRDPAPAPDLAAALADAVAFTAEHGGWPATPGGVVLTGVAPVVARGSLSAPRLLGYRFTFHQRVEGYLIADRTLAVVEVDARGVVYWRRRFVEIGTGGSEDALQQAIQPAGDALERAAALGFEELPEASRLVGDIQLVYIQLGSVYQMPAWQLAMRDGTVVWVSAWPGGDVRVNAAAR